MTYGNQHRSRKQDLLDLLDRARFALKHHLIEHAQQWLDNWREAYAAVPASTKRRWRCGR